MLKDALVCILEHLCRIEGKALVLALGSYKALPVPARKALLVVLGNAVASDELMDAVATASSQVPSDKKIAAFAQA